MQSLAILGASGHGKVIADIAEECGWDKITFFDDAWPGKAQNGSWTVIGNTMSLLNSINSYGGVIVAIGDNKLRKHKLDFFEKEGIQLVTLIHPSATISKYARLGIGTVVMPGVVVNAGADIGKGVILNTSCTVDHDCRLGDAVHISPGAHLAGNVTVGTMSWVGISASIRQNIAIGKEVIVGMGAAVVSDLPDSVTAVGIPSQF